LGICTRVGISRECPHFVSGLSQYAYYGSRTTIELRHKPIQILLTLNEIICAMAAVRIPGSRNCHFVETVQDERTGGEGALKYLNRVASKIGIGMVRVPNQ